MEDIALVRYAWDYHPAFVFARQYSALNHLDHAISVELRIAGAGLLGSKRKDTIQIQSPIPIRCAHRCQRTRVVVERPYVLMRSVAVLDNVKDARSSFTSSEYLPAEFRP